MLQEKHRNSSLYKSEVTRLIWFKYPLKHLTNNNLLLRIIAGDEIVINDRIGIGDEAENTSGLDKRNLFLSLS